MQLKNCIKRSFAHILCETSADRFKFIRSQSNIQHEPLIYPFYTVP